MNNLQRFSTSNRLEEKLIFKILRKLKLLDQRDINTFFN